MLENKCGFAIVRCICQKDDMGNQEKLKMFIRGPLQMMASSVCFAFMVYYGKLATLSIPSTEVTFFRLALGVLVALIMVKTDGAKLITVNIKLLLMRGFFGGVAVLLFFMAIEKGTVTNSTVLQNTYPIFAVLISFYLLKEKIHFRSVSFMAMTFLGIILLIRPDIGLIKTGDMLALASGVLGGFAVTAIRQLRQNDESVWTIFFYFCIFGMALSLLLAIPHWEWPLLGEYWLIFLTSLMGLLGQVMMTAAYKYCNALLGGILSMGSSVFSFLIGVFLLNEVIGWLDLMGIFLIILGNVLVVVFEEEKPEKIAGQVP